MNGWAFWFFDGPCGPFVNMFKECKRLSNISFPEVSVQYIQMPFEFRDIWACSINKYCQWKTVRPAAWGHLQCSHLPTSTVVGSGTSCSWHWLAPVFRLLTLAKRQYHFVISNQYISEIYLYKISVRISMYDISFALIMTINLDRDLKMTVSMNNAKVNSLIIGGQHAIKFINRNAGGSLTWGLTPLCPTTIHISYISCIILCIYIYTYHISYIMYHIHIYIYLQKSSPIYIMYLYIILSLSIYTHIYIYICKYIYIYI